MSKKFATGTIVQLRCGGPPMTVSSLCDPESKLISCEWFIDGDLRRDVFDDVNLHEFIVPAQAPVQ